MHFETAACKVACWLLPAASLSGVLCTHAAEVPKAAALPRAEVRVLAAGNQVLLSRAGAPLAVAQLRPPAGAQPVLSPAAAREALRAADERALDGTGMSRLLPPGGEQVRESQFPVPQGDAADRLSVILRARAVAAGARLLFSSAFTGPSRDDLAPGGKLPRPAPLELAIQVFPDAAGRLPETALADNSLVPVALPSPGKRKDEGGALPATGQLQRRARLWTLETTKDFRVVIARSGPAEWLVQRLPDALLFTARLLSDPREPAEYGPFVVYLGAGADEAPPELSPLRLDRKETPARDFVEGTVRVYACGADPFVLAEAAVIAEIACPPKPDGDVPLKRLPCFFWEAPSAAPAEGEFRFRFAPPAEGVYGVRITVVAATGQARGDATAIRAGPPASAGFVKVRPGERLFRLDEGSVFLPVGATRPVTGRDTAALWRRHFAELARHGGTASYVSAACAGLPLEGPEAGRFDPDVANTLDETLCAAQARDVRLILAAEHGLAISQDSALHPYFREKGGPLAAAPEFFRNPAAKRLFQNRLTYLAARYSAYRSVLAWDLMDAVDSSWPALRQDPDGPALKAGEADLARRARRDVQQWVEEMALHVKGMDGHEHPVCVSLCPGLRNPWTDLERSEHLDWTMVQDEFPSAAAWTEAEQWRDDIAPLRTWAVSVRQPGRAHKPFLVAWRSLNFSADISARKHIDGLPADAREVFWHNSLFAGAAGGLAGAPLLPWGMEKAQSRECLAAASRFASALAAAAEAEGQDELRVLEETVEAPGKVSLRVLGRVGQRGMALWIQDRRSTWSSKEACSEVRDAELRLPGLVEGDYTLVWLSTWTGRIVTAEAYTAPGKHVDKPLEPTVVRVPPFRRDIALLLTRQAH